MGGYITMAATIKSRVDHLSASVCVHYSTVRLLALLRSSTIEARSNKKNSKNFHLFFN